MKKISILVGILALFMLVPFACQKDVDQINIDEPRELGNKRMVVKTIMTDGSAPNNVSVSISGPVNKDTTVSSEEVTLDGFVNGEYLVTVSKPGYISSTKTVNYQLSEDDDILSIITVPLKLNKVNPPTNIDHEQGGTIEIKAEQSLFPGDIRINIPPGAIEGSGTTPISITPAFADVSYQPDGIYPISSMPIHLVCEPSGLEFKEPIEVIFSTENFDFNEDETHQMVYFDKDATSGELFYPTKNPEYLDVEINEKNKEARVMIPHFSSTGWVYLGDDGRNKWNYYFNNFGDPPVLSQWECIASAANAGDAIVAPVIVTIDHEIFYSGGSDCSSFPDLRDFYCLASSGANARYQTLPGGATNYCEFDAFEISDGCSGCPGEYAINQIRYQIMQTDILAFDKNAGETSPPDLNNVALNSFLAQRSGVEECFTPALHINTTLLAAEFRCQCNPNPEVADCSTTVIDP